MVDSLRRDYLSPYNKKVTFTASIEKFAQDSVVMENAFTHYGGTGLSEPSIWVGVMLLHKQYVTPFAPMNALQKMEVEKYQSYISKDFILNTVVAQRSDPVRPIFAYTQPQNLHISVINREGGTVPLG